MQRKGFLMTDKPIAKKPRARKLKVFEDPTNGKLYCAYSKRPADFICQPFDGKYYRREQRDEENGAISNTDYLVCEDCWKDVPKYVDFPRGLVSPESDGDRGGNFPKHRQKAPPEPLQNVNAMATEAMQKVVCLECYLLAFKRFYPKVKPPALRSVVYEVKDYSRIEQPSMVVESAPEPRA
jgi:hypothetical protein